MAIYLFLLGLLSSSVLFDRKDVSNSQKKVVIFFFVILFTLFRGLRWETGTDWNSYLSIFNEVTWSDILNQYDITKIEKGYVFLNLLVKSIGGSYTTFLLSTNFFILFAYAKFALTNSSSPIYVFVLLVFSAPIFPIRITLAGALIIFGLHSFSKQNLLRTVVCSLLAITIHHSAMLFLPVYLFAYYVKITKRTAVIICGTIIFLIYIDFIDDLIIAIANMVSLFDGIGEAKILKYLNYQGNITMIYPSISNQKVTIFILIVTLILFGNLSSSINVEKDPKITLFYSLYVVFSIIPIICFTSSMSNLERVQNHFMFTFSILFSEFLSHGKQQHRQSQYIYTGIYLLFILYRSSVMLYNSYPETLIPYTSVFDRISNN